MPVIETAWERVNAGECAAAAVAALDAYAAALEALPLPADAVEVGGEAVWQRSPE